MWNHRVSFAEDYKTRKSCELFTFLEFEMHGYLVQKVSRSDMAATSLFLSTRRKNGTGFCHLPDIAWARHVTWVRDPSRSGYN
jgi:hypothetical protein